MSADCIRRILLLGFFVFGTLTAGSDTLYIRCGHVYQGKGEWSPPGQLWAVTSGKTFPVETKTFKKAGFLDMSRFWMIPALKNIWLPLSLDSSYQQYPYVQTGLPRRAMEDVHQKMLNKGICSFILYPETPGIRSGDVLEMNSPGTFSLKGLMIFQETMDDSLYKNTMLMMDHSCSVREKERLYQWKNFEFPVFCMKKDTLGREYMFALNYQGDFIDTTHYNVINTLQDIESTDKSDSLIVKYLNTTYMLKTLHSLEDPAKIRFLDHIAGMGSLESYPPHILFLSVNPLHKPSSVKFIMINGKFSVNP